MDPDLDFIVWHDAQLERIVHDGDEVRLEFSEVPLYRKIRPGLWDWESGPVALVLRGAQVDCDPPGDERSTGWERGAVSGWVMDCTRSEPMAQDDIQSLGRGVGPGCIAFLMNDGSTVSATFQHARLTIVGPLEKVMPYEEPPPVTPEPGER
jgi:hypothetical protein